MGEKDDDLIQEQEMEQLENTVEKEGPETNANEKVEELMEEKTEQLETTVEEKEELETNASE